MRALFNCTHSRGGGGLTWAHELARRLDPAGFQWYICAPAESWTTIQPPQSWIRWDAPTGWRSHAWEQIVLPRLVRRHGIRVCLCNANYGPLWLPRTCSMILILHTETQMGGPLEGMSADEILKRLKEATNV